MTPQWKPRFTAVTKRWARASAENYMPDYLRRWLARMFTGSLEAIRCRMQPQPSCMRCSASRVWEFLPRWFTSSENTGTWRGQSVHCTWREIVGLAAQQLASDGAIQIHCFME